MSVDTGPFQDIVAVGWPDGDRRIFDTGWQHNSFGYLNPEVAANPSGFNITLRLEDYEFIRTEPVEGGGFNDFTLIFEGNKNRHGVLAWRRVSFNTPKRIEWNAALTFSSIRGDVATFYTDFAFYQNQNGAVEIGSATGVAEVGAFAPVEFVVGLQADLTIGFGYNVNRADVEFALTLSITDL
jgi:hypothetical protein